MKKMIQGDCLEVMRSMADGSIDCVVTDPPYKIVSGGMTSIKGGIFDKSKYEHTSTGKMFENNDILFSQWLPEVFRIVKDNSHTYIMINGRNVRELITEAERAGFKFQNLLIWDKGNVTPNRYYMQRAEFILMLKKGASKTINNPGTSNLLSFKNEVGRKYHPTQKPIALMALLIENSTRENDIILDPFAGTGSTTIAAKMLNRNYIGIELNPQYYEIAQKRLQEESGK